MWTAFSCLMVETTAEIFKHPNGPSVSLNAGEFSNEGLSDYQLSEEYPQHALMYDVTSDEILSLLSLVSAAGEQRLHKWNFYKASFGSDCATVLCS